MFQEDDELAPMLFADYYLDCDPESCFVAEMNQRVVGYIVGCKNTEDYRQALRWRIAPRAALRMMAKTIGVQYRRKTTYQALWWHLLARLRPHCLKRLVPSTKRYPAHSHTNVAAGHRSRGTGYALSVALHDHLREQGISGLHTVIVEKAGLNAYSNYLCEKRGYQIVERARHELLEKIAGEEWCLTLLVCDLEREPR